MSLEARLESSGHRKWKELGWLEEVRSMARNGIFDRVRGSWRVREVDYVYDDSRSVFVPHGYQCCILHSRAYKDENLAEDKNDQVRSVAVHIVEGPIFSQCVAGSE